MKPGRMLRMGVLAIAFFFGGRHEPRALAEPTSDGWKDLPHPAAHLGTYLARESGVPSGNPDRLAATARDTGLLSP